MSIAKQCDCGKCINYCNGSCQPIAGFIPDELREELEQFKANPHQFAVTNLIEMQAKVHYETEPILQTTFIKGANFALEMALKELEEKRTEVIQINGLRSEVVAWSDIEALLGKFNAGF